MKKDSDENRESRVFDILIVDDEPEGLKALSLTFERAKEFKCRITAVSSGEEALRVLEKQAFDLVISDYKMPVMDGIQLLTRVKETHPGTLRILITAYPDLVIATTAIKEAEINNYFEKPWNNREIIAIVHAALKRKSEREAFERGEFDGVNDALETIKQLQKDITQPLPGDLIHDFPRLVFKFNSGRDFNRFSYETRKLSNITIEDAYVFENEYVITVIIHPHTHLRNVK